MIEKIKAYKPGLHIVATLFSTSIDKLAAFEQCKTLIDALIVEYNLLNLGEVYYNFSPSGFTAIVCLSESHLSIHTWPEYQKINLDIYLSNFKRTNNQSVADVYAKLVEYFDATITDEHRLER